MYPIGGFVYVSEYRDWQDKVKGDKHGPYEIKGYIKILPDSSNIYYELDGADRHYLEREVEAAGKEEDLYHKLTQHMEIEECPPITEP
jgi:hypothetical protein